MRPTWLLPILSLLVLQAARGSPLTSTSSTASNPLNAVSGVSRISATPSLSWTAHVLPNLTSQDSIPITGSTRAPNTSGPVTVVKTIELIPQPVLSISSSPQTPVPQPGHQSLRGPMLQPVIVGGITYAPVRTHYTHSNVVSWGENPRASQTNSEGVEWHEYYAKHISNPDELDRETPKPGQGQGGLPPVIVGGLTYRPVGKELESGWQTPAPVNAADSAIETGKPAANPSMEGGTMSPPEQSGSMAAKSSYPAGPGPPNRESILPQNPPSPPASSVFVLGSDTLTILPKSSASTSDSSTLLPGSPEIKFSSIAYSLNPSAILAVDSSTFAPATPSLHANEGPSSPLTAANETFIPLDSTAISIDGTTLSVSGPALTQNGTLLSLAPAGLVVGSSTYAFATPAPNTAMTTTTSGALAPTSSFGMITVQSIIPASPPTFTIAGETFTAYPSGLAIAGTEVFQGSTAITLSGTAISLGNSEVVIGTSTIPFASVTGLGAAISSGLGAGGSISGDAFGPTATSTGAKESQASAAGQLEVRGSMMMVWFWIMVLMIVVV